jgi:hypothetical protein
LLKEQAVVAGASLCDLEAAFSHLGLSMLVHQKWIAVHV